MSYFDKTGDGRIATEQSILDHANHGQVPPCPECNGQFEKFGEDRLDGELAGTRYICLGCGMRLLVVND